MVPCEDMCSLVMNSKPSNAVNAFRTYQNKVAGFVVCQCSGTGCRMFVSFLCRKVFLRSVVVIGKLSVSANK